MKIIIRNFLGVLRRFKMATLLNIMGLAVAFAAFMVIVMQVDFDKNFDAYHKDAECLYRVEMQIGEGTQAVMSRPLIDLFINNFPHIQAGALVNPWGNEALFLVDRNGAIENYLESMTAVYPSYTNVFDFSMKEGTAEALKEPGKILIPESIARKIFGTEQVVGKMMKTPNRTLTVGGVYKDFPRNSMVGNVIYSAISEQENLHSWGNSNYYLYIRLDSLESAADLAEDFVKYFKANEVGKNMSWIPDIANVNFRLTPVKELHYVTDVMYDMIPKSSESMMLVLIAIAVVIMLIAGINFTNFSTALTPMRIKSINTQKVLGSSESMLRFTLLLEAIVVSVVSYLLSLCLVWLASHSFVAGLVDADMTLSAHLLLVGSTALMALGVGVLAGLYPSWYVTSFPPALVLKGSFGLSPKGRAMRNVLIGIQFVASFVLIIGAMFMYLQNYFMQTTPLGYDKEELITTNITPPVNQSREAFTNQLKSFSGIADVTYSEALLSSQDQYMGWGRPLNGKQIDFQCLPVDPSFLDVLGVQVTSGRSFRKEDALTADGVYIFNERAMHDYSILLGDKIDGAEVIGFAPNVKFASFRQEVTPMAFFVWGTQNWGTTPNYAYIKVKAGSDMHAAMEHIRESLKMFDPVYPFNIRFYDEVLNSLYEKEERVSSLITLFSLIAVFISIVGVFGLVVFDSEYRKKEIGIRKVLGSTTGQILIIFNKTYVKILLICFIPAAPIAYYGVSRWLESFAYKTPMYWWVYLVAFAFVAVITILTVTFQNWWTANENPINSLKSE